MSLNSQNGVINNNTIEFDCPSLRELQDDHSFWKIYDLCFPREEKESQNSILRMLSNEVGFVVRVIFRGESGRHMNTIGLSIVHILKVPPVLFVVYLAVEKSFRHHKLGDRLIRYSQKMGTEISAKYGLPIPIGIVCEVDNPLLATEYNEKRLRERREQYFLKKGLSVIKTNYIQPPLYSAGNEVMMNLMYMGLVDYIGESQMTYGGLPSLVKAIYLEKYLAVNKIPIGTLRRLFDKMFPGDMLD